MTAPDRTTADRRSMIAQDRYQASLDRARRPRPPRIVRRSRWADLRDSFVAGLLVLGFVLACAWVRFR